MPAFLPTLCVDLTGHGLLRLSGEDRVRFLNGQATNDVKALTPGRGCATAFVNAKGKMRGDGVILCAGDSLWVECEPDVAPRLAEELERFIIADDVTVENLTTTWGALALAGGAAAGTLGASGVCPTPPPDLFALAPLDGADLTLGFTVAERRAEVSVFHLWAPREKIAKLSTRLRPALEKAGGRMGAAAELEILRVEAGLPRFGAEMDATTIPQEDGLETVAISFHKGCYVGQEVISRIKSVGHVNRGLVRLKLPPAARAGSPLRLGDREVGRLGSAVDSPRFGRIGLALVRQEATAPATVLDLPEGKGEVVSNFAAAPSTP